MNMDAQAAVPLAEGRTNPKRGSQVIAEVEPLPAVFYRPETNELLVVPADRLTAFENECRFTDRLIRQYMSAKETYQTAQATLFEAQRNAEGPTRTVPQHPQVLVQAQADAFAAERALVEAQKALEAEFKPLGKLDDTGGKLYELVPIRRRPQPLDAKREQSGGPAKRTERDQQAHTWARKWTYVRSDKVKDHFRSYNLSDAEQAKYQSNEKKSAKAPGEKIDMGRLREQINKLEGSAKWKKEVGAHGTLLDGVNESIRATLTDWADALNAGNDYADLGVEAQLLRYFAGAGAQASWDPKKKNLAIRGDARAEFAVAEARLKATAYFPGRAGHMLELVGPKSRKKYKTGLVRASAQLELLGLAGASACAQLGLEVDYSGTGKAGVRGRPSAKPLSTKGLELGGQIRDGGQIGAAGDLFAGARVAGSLSGSVDWNSPEDKAFKPLGKIGPGGQLQAGAGISGQFKIDFVEGKFRFLMAGSVCLGVGAGGKLEFEVDAAHTLEFTKYLAYMLYSVGYEFLEIITKQAFLAWQTYSLWAIQHGKRVQDAIDEHGDRIRIAARTLLAQMEIEAERVALMERVLESPQALEYAPPETKGMILYQLTRHGLLTKTVFLPENQGYMPPQVELLDRRKRAVLQVIRKARSKAEYRNIFQHMTINGEKDPADWQANEAAVQRFLDMKPGLMDRDGELRDFEQSLAAVYHTLYDEPVLGYAFVDNDSQVYIARAGRGHHDGYTVAGGYSPGPEFPAWDGLETDKADTRYA